MWLRKFRKLFVFNHISVAIYSIINCLIVFICHRSGGSNMDKLKDTTIQMVFNVISTWRLWNNISYFWASSWIFDSEMRKVLLYHFAPCTVSFCPMHGAKWYSWPHILNAWFQTLMSLYACFSFSQVVANTWQCIIHLKAIRYIQS